MRALCWYVRSTRLPSPGVGDFCLEIRVGWNVHPSNWRSVFFCAFIAFVGEMGGMRACAEVAARGGVREGRSITTCAYLETWYDYNLFT